MNAVLIGLTLAYRPLMKLGGVVEIELFSDNYTCIHVYV